MSVSEAGSETALEETRAGACSGVACPGSSFVDADPVDVLVAAAENADLMQIALALAATLVSACALNIGYLLEHSTVRTLPPLSLRTPLAALRLLLRSPRWLLGFGSEAIGWLLFVLALSLAPLSVVQATAAGGIGILALMVARVTHVPLSRGERAGVAFAVGGLGLLGISLAGGHGEGAGASYLSVVLWLSASALAALISVTVLAGLIGSGPSYGLATGLLFPRAMSRPRARSRRAGTSRSWLPSFPATQPARSSSRPASSVRARSPQPGSRHCLRMHCRSSPE
jgi:hypothetical protein